MANPLGAHCKSWGSLMRDTFVASQKGGGSIYINVLEKHQHCRPICLFFQVRKSLENAGMWSFLTGRGKPVTAPGKRRSQFHQQLNVGAGKTLLLPLGACRLPLTWAGGGVWQSIQSQKPVDRSMEIQRIEATGMLQETDLQNQSNKTEYSLCHSGKHGQGWAEREWGGGQGG